MNGKAEAASGAPTCEKRVNTFSFCGTGGSPGKKRRKSCLRRSLFTKDPPFKMGDLS